MDLTLTIAIYAAAVSTVTALWTIGRDVVIARRRIRVTLDIGNAVRLDDRLSQVMLNLRATNSSRSQNVGVHTVLFEGTRLRWDTPDMGGGVRPASQDDPLPALLAPAQSVTLEIYLGGSTLTEFQVVRAIAVEDSNGRKHRLPRKELDTAKLYMQRLQ